MAEQSPPPADVYRRLLWRTAIAAAACGIVVAGCYFFVDRSVAFFVERHAIDKHLVLKWLTYPPPWLQSASPLVLVLLMMIRARGSWSRWQATLFFACVSLIVADQFRTTIGDLFGRYWPATWHDHNPSLIGTGTYGFHAFEHGGYHPFDQGDDAGSFPSGHAARICGFFSVFWIGLPRGRWLYALLATPMLVALVGMNYHFVSDVIAGSVLGALVGIYTATMANLVAPRGD